VRQEQAQVLLHQVPPPPRHPLRLGSKAASKIHLHGGRRRRATEARAAGSPSTDRPGSCKVGSS
jgi:hypothetical protein